MLLIGSASSRRALLLTAAAQRHGARLQIVEWDELIADETALERHIAQATAAGHRWCKIDPAPPAGPSAAKLIARGWQLCGADEPPPREVHHGELLYLHWWYAGMAALVRRLAIPLQALQLLNPIEQILVMCDKWACQQHLQRQALEIPELLGQLPTFDELDARWPIREYPALFIKARYGSSAAGVVALRRHPDGRLAAYSSARLEHGSLFNHLHVTRYSDRDSIRQLVDTLCVQGAYVERWLAKPRVPHDREVTYDLRVVAFRGAARQRIARLSRSPMTNLHLGNRRADPTWLQPAQLQLLETAVARAAQTFAAECIGFDVVLGPERAAIVEANAFGDLLPDLHFQGATTHDDQVRRVKADEC